MSAEARAAYIAAVAAPRAHDAYCRLDHRRHSRFDHAAAYIAAFDEALDAYDAARVAHDARARAAKPAP